MKKIVKTWLILFVCTLLILTIVSLVSTAISWTSCNVCPSSYYEPALADYLEGLFNAFVVSIGYSSIVVLIAILISKFVKKRSDIEKYWLISVFISIFAALLLVPFIFLLSMTFNPFVFILM